MGLEAMTYTVVRRFNDFVWLRNQLREALPYLIIPSLPEKQQIGRFNTDFVDVRHRALQRWADRISTHAEITTTGLCSCLVYERSLWHGLLPIAVLHVRPSTSTAVCADAAPDLGGDSPATFVPLQTPSASSFRFRQRLLLRSETVAAQTW